jgi:hypothetical protein
MLRHHQGLQAGLWVCLMLQPNKGYVVNAVKVLSSAPPGQQRWTGASASRATARPGCRGV